MVILIKYRNVASGMGKEIRFIDLFCGIGGMRIGLEKAGGRCVYSCEVNEPARKTYEANFEPVTDGDITEVDTRDIPDHDVLAAGFPCQPFSLAGVVKRNSLGQPSGFDAPEGKLFNNILNILREKRPHAFLLENVKHLQSHDCGKTFKLMLRRLHDVGYDVKHAVVDAKTVVPQHRERLFMVGFDREVEFEFPKMKNIKPKLRDILEPDPGTLPGSKHPRDTAPPTINKYLRAVLVIPPA